MIVKINMQNFAPVALKLRDRFPYACNFRYRSIGFGFAWAWPVKPSGKRFTRKEMRQPNAI